MSLCVFLPQINQHDGEIPMQTISDSDHQASPASIVNPEITPIPELPETPQIIPPVTQPYTGYTSDFDITPLNIDEQNRELPDNPDIKKYQEHLWHNRLLLLAGNAQYKKQLARQIARHLQAQVFNVGIYEIHSIHPSTQKITDELKNYDRGGIFIFQGIQPHELGFCYEQLMALTSNLYFFIFTTEVPQAQWYLPEQLKTNWFDTPETQPSVHLANLFSSWFAQELTDKERLLVMGILLLYGLSKPQMFAVMDRFVADAKLPNKAGMGYFDYQDVNTLAPYFQNTSNYIEISNDQLLPIGLTYCWQHKYRHLATLLDVSVNIITESFAKHVQNRVLFGTAKKREQIRNTLTRFLGFALSQDTALAEEHLAYLIQQNHTDSYVAAGKAVAYYYATQTDTAEKLINAWLDEKKDAALKKLLMANSQLTDKDQLSQDALEKIRTLVAFSLMFITHQYPTNQLSAPLKERVVNITQVGVKSNTLKTYLGDMVLKAICSQHFELLEPHLEDFVCKQNLTDAMPDILNAAMSNHPKAVWAVLHRWIDLIDTNHSELKKEQIENQKKLITVALKTIGKAYKANTEYAVQLLDKVLSSEKKPEIRQEALYVCMNLVGQGIKVIDHRIESLIAAINLEEREKFVQFMTNEYLKQRKKLNNGDIKQTILDEQYNVWLDDDKQRVRPTLEVEKTLAEWIGQANTAQAAQLAYLAESSFVNTFEKTEQSLIKEYKNKKKEEAKKKAEEPEEKPPAMPKTSLSWYSRYISIPLAAQAYAGNISAILPAALEQSEEEQQGMVKRMSKDGRLELALALERTLLVEKFKPEFFLITFIVMVFMVVLIFF